MALASHHFNSPMFYRFFLSSPSISYSMIWSFVDTGQKLSSPFLLFQSLTPCWLALSLVRLCVAECAEQITPSATPIHQGPKIGLDFGVDWSQGIFLKVNHHSFDPLLFLSWPWCSSSLIDFVLLGSSILQKSRPIVSGCWLWAFPLLLIRYYNMLRFSHPGPEMGLVIIFSGKFLCYPTHIYLLSLWECQTEAWSWGCFQGDVSDIFHGGLWLCEKDCACPSIHYFILYCIKGVL